MPVPKLTPEQIEQELAGLPQWRFEAGRIEREYRFRDFVEAFAFMTAAALRIQEMDHHPEWSNVYGTVRVGLVTHDAGGVSARDIELARKLEALASRWPRP
ncbi:MAG: 4a-hydroxytetrahydrobiopterin dehydratase [Candidatus Eisenbacteria bacterium]|nr:4a-hydroxytetrahydrobiopterin dehydratase [Candidatus Eisenbacteria bacterium]